MKNNKIEINNTTDPESLKVILKKTYIKRLMKLKSIILLSIMMKITKNHYQF